MTSIVSLPKASAATGSGPRPINLATDLGPLADLIERVFADTMDAGGRAALREMRMLGRLGRGVNVLQRLGDGALGIQLGYVWIEDGQLVGNVSVYPAQLPGDRSTWIVANVGTHPDYQRRGIARKLMIHSLDLIRARGGRRAVLQVDYDNVGAQGLYISLGFTFERAWTVWRRNATLRGLPPPEIDQVYITHPRFSDRRALWSLAEQLRPDHLGGLGWLRPLHPSTVHLNLLKRLNEFLNLRSTEQLVIRSEDERAIRAALFVERGAGISTRLTLLVHPDYQGLYDEALISTAVRRFSGDNLVLEHPYHETVTNALLERYGFRHSRSAFHMRLDV